MMSTEDNSRYPAFDAVDFDDYRDEAPMTEQFIREMKVGDLRPGDQMADNDCYIIAIDRVTELGTVLITYADDPQDKETYWKQLNHVINPAYRVIRRD